MEGKQHTKVTEKKKKKEGKHEEAYTGYRIFPKWFQTFIENQQV